MATYGVKIIQGSLSCFFIIHKSSSDAKAMILTWAFWTDDILFDFIKTTVSKKTPKLIYQNI